MDTIRIPVRKMFFESLLADVIEAQDQTEALARIKLEYEALPQCIQEELTKAYAALFAARVALEQEIDAL